MSSIDFRARFLDAYKGDIKDPILTTLLETINSYQENVKTQHLLTTYTQRSDQLSDGLFEVLRRHLFGQMFPGPAFVVTQLSLREVASAHPLLLDQNHYFSLYDHEGAEVLFAPQQPSWVAPAKTNDVRIKTYGEDLMLGFDIVVDHLAEAPEGIVSVYTGEVDPLTVERLRCRLQGGSRAHPPPASIIRSSYPGKFSPIDDFFHTPFEHRFLSIPFQLFTGAAKRSSDGLIWLPFQGLGAFGQQLEKKLVMNAFAMWNMVQYEAAPIPVDNFRYTMSITDHGRRETIIGSVHDFGTTPPIEYMEASTVMDPSYPFQFTSSGNIRRDELILAFSPTPQGEIKVRYFQYDIGESATDIASGRTFGLYQGIEERIKSVTSLTPAGRLNALNDKEKIWDYFRSLLASRNRWLTREDLRAAIGTYPPFSAKSSLVAGERIRFEEQVGRVNGFLTPYTEITVPLREKVILNPVDRPYFERELGLYLKRRTVHGNFLRVKLSSVDEL